MLDVIEKLLILQDRDRKLARLRAELGVIGPQRDGLRTKTSSAEKALEDAKRRVNELESQRKDLELEVEAKQQQISRYANQQLETRKNEEYQALTKEIESCKAAIVKNEDQQLELMEQMEAARKKVGEATAALDEARKLMEAEISAMDDREKVLEKELAELESDREQLALAVESGARHRYERLMASKGQHVVVGVHHGVCGGCHMKLPASILVACKAEEEIVTCTNCGRILYYTRDMSLAAAD